MRSTCWWFRRPLRIDDPILICVNDLQGKPHCLLLYTRLSGKQPFFEMSLVVDSKVAIRAHIITCFYSRCSNKPGSFSMFRLKEVTCDIV